MTPISKERIERAARAHARMFRQTGGNTSAAMQAALEADSPALLAAKIEGMREVVAMIGAKRKAFGEEPAVAWPLIELTGEAANRIAALQTEMEKAGG